MQFGWAEPRISHFRRDLDISDIPGCEAPPRVGLHKTQSLRSILVRADVTAERNKDMTHPTGHHKCGQCNICPLTVVTKEINFPDKGFSYRLNIFFKLYNKSLCLPV